MTSHSTICNTSSPSAVTSRQSSQPSQKFCLSALKRNSSLTYPLVAVMHHLSFHSPSSAVAPKIIAAKTYIVCSVQSPLSSIQTERFSQRTYDKRKVNLTSPSQSLTFHHNNFHPLKIVVPQPRVRIRTPLHIHYTSPTTDPHNSKSTAPQALNTGKGTKTNECVSSTQATDR